MKKNSIAIYVIMGVVLFVFAFIIWYFAPVWFDRLDAPYYGHMIGGWGMPFGMLAMGVFWVCVIAMGVRAFSHRDDRRNDDAIVILKKRLANGEITVAEYESLMNKLKGDE